MRILSIKLLGLLVIAMLLYWLITGMGCAVDTDVSGGDMDRLKEKRDRWCSEMETTNVITKRCDRLTFAALANVGCSSPKIALGAHLYDGAAYHRDVAPCFPNESRSECSPDALITGLNAAVRGAGWTKPQLLGIRSYLQEHNYKCGDGPGSLTDVAHIRGQLDRVIDYVASPGKLALTGNWDDSPSRTAVSGVVPTHNQYLSAIYMDTEHVIRGHWTNQEGVALRILAAARPNSTPIAALAGDKQNAVELLNDQFSEDEMPLTDGYDGWGSSPDGVMFVWAVSLLGDK